MNVHRTHVMHTFVSVVVFSTVDFLLFVTAPCLRVCFTDVLLSYADN